MAKNKRRTTGYFAVITEGRRPGDRIEHQFSSARPVHSFVKKIERGSTRKVVGASTLPQWPITWDKDGRALPWVQVITYRPPTDTEVGRGDVITVEVDHRQKHDARRLA